MRGWRAGNSGDVCQDVCPWNRKAPVSREPAFTPTERYPDAGALTGMDDAAIRERFRGTPLLRARPSGLRRNASIYLENSG